jgi:hypothetical protein
MSYSRWMDKQIMTLPNSGVLFIINMKWVIKLWEEHEWGEHECIILSERNESERNMHYILHMYLELQGIFENSKL